MSTRICSYISRELPFSLQRIVSEGSELQSHCGWGPAKTAEKNSVDVECHQFLKLLFNLLKKSKGPQSDQQLWETRWHSKSQHESECDSAWIKLNKLKQLKLSTWLSTRKVDRTGLKMAQNNASWCFLQIKAECHPLLEKGTVLYAMQCSSPASNKSFCVNFV